MKLRSRKTPFGPRHWRRRRTTPGPERRPLIGLSRVSVHGEHETHCLVQSPQTDAVVRVPSEEGWD